MTPSLRFRSIARAVVLLGVMFFSLPTAARDVLVVMSYEEENPWCREIRQGIESVLGGEARVVYRYLNTKRDPAGGPGRAAVAYRDFLDLAPDGVIAVDDNAQSMFVVPYLLGSHPTPVMFSGVNAEPDRYGYPAATVSGILERGHIAEAIGFAREITPTAKDVVVLTRDGPSGRAIADQVEAERERYPLPVSEVLLLGRLDEVQERVSALDAATTLLYVDSLEGIVDADGNALDNRGVLDGIYEVFDGHVVAANRYQVVDGALSAVVKTGFEQGATAAEMMLQTFAGTPVEDIPLRRNYQGQRYINASRVDAMGIVLDPTLLRVAEVVKTGPAR